MKIMHFGLGRFHRGHQAVYFEELNRLLQAEGEEPWWISAWSVRSPGPSLGPAGYPVYVPGQQPTWVRSIAETGSLGSAGGAKGLRWLDSELQLVTLTVTEKGYAEPVYGLLREGLRARSAAGLGPVTVLSCDNLLGNGDRLRDGVGGKPHATFPNSVVDRIVPALDPADLERFAAQAGVAPTLLIVTESFRQWVVEDNFAGERPPLERVGVEWVARARPYEQQKLGILNLAHSWLAYSGLLRGYQFVHQAVADDELRRKLVAILAQSLSLLEVPVGAPKYSEQVLQRFANPHLPHSLRQIAMDGSVKLPQRLFPQLRQRKDSVLREVLTAWLEFVWQTRQRGEKLEDPLESELETWPALTREEFQARILRLPPLSGL